MQRSPVVPVAPDWPVEECVCVTVGCDGGGYDSVYVSVHVCVMMMMRCVPAREHVIEHCM